MKTQAPKVEQPIEDMAISCLLQIDQREDRQSGEWRRRIFTNPRTKVRSYSSHGSCNKHQDHRPRLSASRRYDQNFEKSKNLWQKQSDSQARREQKNNPISLNNEKNKFNEGQYWSSRVNWMDGNQGELVASQPKLNKNFSFGSELYSRKNSKKGHVGDEAERKRRDQYRTNLIYSLINNVEIRQLNKSSPSRVKCIRKKEGTDTNLVRKQENGLTNPLQNYMREVYNRVRECRQENQLLRPSEHERSVLIRELLINLGNVKDFRIFPAQLANPQSQIQEHVIQVVKIKDRRGYRPDQKNAQEINKHTQSRGRNTYKPPKSTALFLNKK